MFINDPICGVKKAIKELVHKSELIIIFHHNSSTECINYLGFTWSNFNSMTGKYLKELKEWASKHKITMETYGHKKEDQKGWLFSW